MEKIKHILILFSLLLSGNLFAETTTLACKIESQTNMKSLETTSVNNMSRSVVINTTSKEVTYRGEVKIYLATEVQEDGSSIYFLHLGGVTVGSKQATKEVIEIDRITGTIVISLFIEKFINGYGRYSDFDKIFDSQNQLARYTGTCKKANALF